MQPPELLDVRPALSFRDRRASLVSDQQYRIVTVNLYADETAWLDGLCDRLKRRGLTKATRSEVVRLAITGLRRRLRDIGDQELVKVFLQELLEHAAHVDPENVT